MKFLCVALPWGKIHNSILESYPSNMKAFSTNEIQGFGHMKWPVACVIFAFLLLVSARTGAKLPNPPIQGYFMKARWHSFYFFYKTKNLISR